MVRRKKSLSNFVLIGLVLSFPWWTRGEAWPRADFSHQLQARVRTHTFSLFQWQVKTLLVKLQQRVSGQGWERGLSPEDKTRLVREYFALGEQRRRLQEEKQRLVAAGGTAGREDSRALDSELQALDGRRTALESQVENILGEQMSRTLAELGLRRGLIDLHLAAALPPVQVAVTPDVFFKFERLPLLLVIAPRNRIEVKTSLFLQPHLSLDQVQQVEDRVDALNVSSVTTPLGGFAAYPSMIPDSESLARNLNVIAHEWIHHYLALRPLGFRYFSSYEMRAINETVADIAGNEIGQAVYERYYASVEKPASVTPPVRSEDGRRRPDFGERMRALRKEVEAYLERDDVPGAEVRMEAARKELVAEGYYLRKLNTAYLSFFGAYAGGGNPYESGLRSLRQQAPSLREFLLRVERIGKAQDFERIVGPTGEASVPSPPGRRRG